MKPSKRVIKKRNAKPVVKAISNPKKPTKWPSGATNPETITVPVPTFKSITSII